MKNVDHPSIAKLFEVFEDELYVYLVMEYVDAVELLEVINEKEVLSERE